MKSIFLAALLIIIAPYCFSQSNGDNFIDPFNKCSDPYLLNLPDDAPNALLNQFTCGRYDDYDQTCLGNFDGGEEMMYQIDVDVPGQTEFVLDPKGTGFTGFVIDSVCPPAEYSLDCMAQSTSTYAEPHSINIFLEIGTYYLMVDTWPSPECISDYDLFINFEPLLCGDVNGDESVNVSDAVYIINFVFAGGTTPEPYRNADTNCDSVVNVSDAVGIINYVFVGGSHPCDPDGDNNLDC